LPEWTEKEVQAQTNLHGNFTAEPSALLREKDKTKEGGGGGQKKGNGKRRTQKKSSTKLKAGSLGGEGKVFCAGCSPGSALSMLGN